MLINPVATKPHQALQDRVNTGALRTRTGFWVHCYIVEARKLEHHYPHALKVKYKGILALILLHPCSNFLGSIGGTRRTSIRDDVGCLLNSSLAGFSIKY